MPENIALLTVKDIINVIVLGYFLFILQGLHKDVKDTRREMTELKTEHDTYKGLSKCALLRSTYDVERDGERRHPQGDE